MSTSSNWNRDRNGPRLSRGLSCPGKCWVDIDCSCLGDHRDLSMMVEWSDMGIKEEKLSRNGDSLSLQETSASNAWHHRCKHQSILPCD